ncbi:MAG TPA: DEAD/DEAH box helicase [Gemmatales bacterium]|nr:DEAD/DEAH box helicase [Gemmatales bacterium]
MNRDALASQYLDTLPFPPYPVQEEALLSWFTAEQGVMVCAPTGTGKTLIAQAALFEALHSGHVAYYTTPLIALTEQKFHEMQAAAVRWGFRAEDVGLVTGHRRVNPEARILVVVAEILLNRLLHSEAFDFSQVGAVVMDEFHSFADPERGIVWELSLAFLPSHVKLLLLSATVGNAAEFMVWLDQAHGRKLELVEGRERKVPLTLAFVPDQLLGEQALKMVAGDEGARKTPALVFCFNRDECWSVAEQLKGLDLIAGPAKVRLADLLSEHDLTQGAGPKLKQILGRGVGVHHAGVLPKYRRLVERLFEQKLLAIAVCTETLAAGINLPARSVVLTSLVKGPAGKQKLIDASTAHQIAGRAGRPQFDTEGFVFALAHEDDVKLFRWRQKMAQLPEKSGDPAVLKQKKELERKKPGRSDKQLYWNEQQFAKLMSAPPSKLYSKGPLPWRLLAYMLQLSPEVSRLREAVRKRFLDSGRDRAGEKHLEQMLKTLAAGGFVTLEFEAASHPDPAEGTAGGPGGQPEPLIRLAAPTPLLGRLLTFRGIHPLFGSFLCDLLPRADTDEKLMALEAVLQMPRPLPRHMRPPKSDERPAGPLEREVVEPELVQRGLMVARPERSADEKDDEDGPLFPDREDERPPSLAEKLQMLFEARFPSVDDLEVQTVWCAAELSRFGYDFNRYVRNRDLIRQEGVVFRHLLRLVLLLAEFAQVTPDGVDGAAWSAELRDLADRLTASCRRVDQASTEEFGEMAQAADLVAGEPEVGPPVGDRP